MSPPFRSCRMSAAVVACGVLAAGAASSGSPAEAVPPPGGCVVEAFGLVCDGPIGPDNTFTRCRISRGMLGARGLYLPATEKCWAVNLDESGPG